MADSGGINAIIAKAVSWAEVLTKSGHIDPTIVSIDARRFNTAMSKSNLFGESMTHFDGTNQCGMFRVNFQRQFYYLYAQKMRQVAYPMPLNNAWKEKVVEAAANVLIIPSTRARPAAAAVPSCSPTDNVSITRYEPEIDLSVEPDSAILEESPSKRQRLLEISSYWPKSPEAYYLFRPRGYDNKSSTTIAGETPQDALNRRILLLQSVHSHEDNWRNVVVGRDADNFCTRTEIANIRQRATFLCCAYQLALEKMNQWTWEDCCREACKQLNSLGMNQATFYKTISEWHGVYRTLEAFPHPNPYVQCGKRPLPRLLKIFPDVKEQIVAYSNKNLVTLTIEGVHDFIVSTVIPRLARVWKMDYEVATAGITSSSTVEDADDNDDSADSPTIPTSILDVDEQLIASFLKAHGLESMSFTTAWRWMRLLNFKYDSRKKSFYVDGHEREDVVVTRNEFCKRYLTELEPYCKRWVQVSKSEAETIKDLDIELGHHYFDIINNKEMIEFHIDYWERNKAPPSPTPVTPSTSIRVSSQATPLIIVGQDKSVFAQFLIGSKTWTGPAGQRPLLPKSEGDGYMLSAFVS